MIYVTTFDAHSAYTEYAASEDMLHPNISYCKLEQEVHYDNDLSKLVVTYCPVSDPSPKKVSESTYGDCKLYGYDPNFGVMGSTMFNKVVINGVEASIAELDANSGMTPFLSAEDCLTVEYTLKDPTFLGVVFNQDSGTLTRIGATFLDCPNITSVQIPNSVTAIGASFINEGVGNTIEFETLEIPDSVTSIAGDAFFNVGFGALTVGSGVTSFGFNGNTWAQSLTIYATTPPSQYIFIGNSDIIYVPESAVDTYKAAWTDDASIIYPISDEPEPEPYHPEK